MHSSVLVSIQVGAVQTLGDASAVDSTESAGWARKPCRTAFIKEAVEGPVCLGAAKLEGDSQADSRHHGGLDKAVLGYSADHYADWRRELNLPDFPHGGFAENFTISGLTEATVCLGDIYRIGEARVQVSQPRQPCWKIARRWGIKDLTARVEATGRTGWYFRVLRQGLVEAGQKIELVERPQPNWTVQRANDVMQNRQSDREAAAELAALDVLSPEWREPLSAAARGG